MKIEEHLVVKYLFYELYLEKFSLENVLLSLYQFLDWKSEETKKKNKISSWNVCSSENLVTDQIAFSDNHQLIFIYILWFSLVISNIFFRLWKKRLRLVKYRPPKVRPGNQ